MSDTTLLEGARRMNEDALVEIFELYAPVLYKYAFRLCRDALVADHIVGDVFTKFLEHLSAGAGPSTNLRSYLYEMAYHLVVDEMRYSQRSAPIEAVSFRHRDVYSTDASVETRVLFQAALRTIKTVLTADQRHVVILRFLNGLSLKETAAILGKEVGNVKVIQSRAIAALRVTLDYQTIETSAISLARGDD